MRQLLSLSRAETVQGYTLACSHTKFGDLAIKAFAAGTSMELLDRGFPQAQPVAAIA